MSLKNNWSSETRKMMNFKVYCIISIQSDIQAKLRKLILNQWESSSYSIFPYRSLFSGRRKWEIGSERHGHCWIGVQRLALQSSEVGGVLTKRTKVDVFPQD